jgi:hypothetical protein
MRWRWMTVVVVMGAVGCGEDGDMESACATYCEEGFDCWRSDSWRDECKDDCTAAMNDASGECQATFVEMSDCIEAATCEDWQSQIEVDNDKCNDQAGAFLDDCSDDVDLDQFGGDGRIERS